MASEGGRLEKILTIESLVHGGDGLARDGGRVVFVPLTAPGDRVRVTIEDGSDRAHLEEILTRGAERQVPPCPVAGTCGGCDWQQVTIDGQERGKFRNVREALQRIGGIKDPPVRSLVPSPRAWRYRRRVRAQLTKDGWGFAEALSHRVVGIATCLLLEPEVERFAHLVSAALRAVGLADDVTAFVIDALEPPAGVHARGAAFLVLRRPLSPGIRRRAETLLRDVSGLSGIVLGSANPEERVRTTLGQPVLVDTGHHRLRVRPDLFTQGNRLGSRLLAEAAAAEVPSGASVLELFAGAGTLTLYLAERAGRLVATEGDGPALELLRASLRDNQREARLVAGPVARLAAGLVAGGEQFDHLVLDPPRAGAKEVMPAVARLARAGITYVSCDPATFARDAKLLIGLGWQITTVIPFDLFPQTHHVELVASFRRA